MDKKAFLRQFISPFINGANFDALLGALAEEVQKQEELSVAVNDQLTITTSSGVYLDKNLASLGITRPSELGMEDLAFKQMGIQVNAQKQITESIHAILSTFYGDETVRAYVTSGIAAPYSFQDGDDLIFQLEDGTELKLEITADQFEDIQNVSAAEIADVITRFIRETGSNGYAEEFLDVDTNLTYVRIFGGAKGPYSFVQITGGRIQNQLEFPEIRNTFLPSNTTVWEITRNVGSTYRFRWVSGPKPLLDQVLPEDKAMIYGPQFQSVGISGTFTISQVRPPAAAPAFNAGYFEVDIQDTIDLKSTVPDLPPPPNTPSAVFSFTVTQNVFDDLKFFLPKKNTPYSNIRYALAWEPGKKLLKVYMPATTKVVRRGLFGSAHLHLLYGRGEFNGSWGSTTDQELKLQIVNQYAIRYKQRGSDALGFNGFVNTTIPIDYIFRESGYTTVVCKEPHGITGVQDQWNRIISDDIITVEVTDMLEDDQINTFLGPYIIDPAAPYTLTSNIVKSREKITLGDIKTSLTIDGSLPADGGFLLFSLGNDQQEGPVRYLNCQSIASLNATTINTISQLGITVTVVTLGAHGAVAGQKVSITGTVNFNGTWTVKSTPAPNVYTFEKTPAVTLFETSGQSLPVAEAAVSTILLDPAYTFKNSHEIGTDMTLLSDTKAYEPRPDGSDYGVYLTGTADGRKFAQELIESITAAGINLQIIIVYPNDIGLGNEGGSDSIDQPPTSDKVNIWGGDE